MSLLQIQVQGITSHKKIQQWADNGSSSDEFDPAAQ
jgi:hypothetical protein